MKNHRGTRVVKEGNSQGGNGYNQREGLAVSSLKFKGELGQMPPPLCHDEGDDELRSVYCTCNVQRALGVVEGAECIRVIGSLVKPKHTSTLRALPVRRHFPAGGGRATPRAT